MQQFVGAVDRIPPSVWDKPGLGIWTVRELVAHVVRIIQRTAVYAEQSAPIDTESGAAYYSRALSTPNVSDLIAERARASVALLGDSPKEAAHVIATQTLETIGGMDDEASVATPFGTLRLIDYLATRTLELVLHTLDLSRAAQFPVETSRTALTSTLDLLIAIAIERGDGTAVVLALSGRQTLPDDFNLLG